MVETKTLEKADDLLSYDDKRVDVVEVPEWSMRVRIGTLEGTDRARFEAYCAALNGSEMPIDYRERLCVLTIIDGQGDRVFGDDQVEALGRKNAAGLKRVFDAASRLNKLGMGDMEEARGNSDGAPSASSGSDSPPSSDAPSAKPSAA